MGEVRKVSYYNLDESACYLNESPFLVHLFSTCHHHHQAMIRSCRVVELVANEASRARTIKPHDHCRAVSEVIHALRVVPSSAAFCSTQQRCFSIDSHHLLSCRHVDDFVFTITCCVFTLCPLSSPLC